MKLSYLFRTREIPNDWLNRHGPRATVHDKFFISYRDDSNTWIIFFAIKVINSGVAFDVITLSAKLIRAINYSL